MICDLLSSSEPSLGNRDVWKADRNGKRNAEENCRVLGMREGRGDESEEFRSCSKKMSIFKCSFHLSGKKAD